MNELYRVIYHNDAGELKVTAKTHQEDAFITAEYHRDRGRRAEIVTVLIDMS